MELARTVRPHGESDTAPADECRSIGPSPPTLADSDRPPGPGETIEVRLEPARDLEATAEDIPSLAAAPGLVCETHQGGTGPNGDEVLLNRGQTVTHPDGDQTMTEVGPSVALALC